MFDRFRLDDGSTGGSSIEEMKRSNIDNYGNNNNNGESSLNTSIQQISAQDFNNGLN